MARAPHPGRLWRAAPGSNTPPFRAGPPYLTNPYPPPGGGAVTSPPMGYRLDYSVSGGVLMVTISGSCPTPGAIARDIGREARENAVRNVLVDVRRMQDRIGKIRDLLAEKDGPKRIAVLDNVLNERLYVFAEIDARARGCALRRFDTQADAMRWLEGAPG